MSTFNDQSMNIGYVCKFRHLFGSLRHSFLSQQHSFKKKSYSHYDLQHFKSIYKILEFKKHKYIF